MSTHVFSRRCVRSRVLGFLGVLFMFLIICLLLWFPGCTVARCVCACTCVCTFVVCTCWKFKMSGWAEIKQVVNSCCAQQIQIWGCCQVLWSSFVAVSNNYCDVPLLLFSSMGSYFLHQSFRGSEMAQVCYSKNTLFRRFLFQYLCNSICFKYQKRRRITNFDMAVDDPQRLVLLSWK